MKKLFYYGDLFMKRSDWRDMALVKFCLFSMGLLAGTQISRKDREPVMLCAFLVFLCTYIPLMVKLLGIVREDIGAQAEE